MPGKFLTLMNPHRRRKGRRRLFGAALAAHQRRVGVRHNPPTKSRRRASRRSRPAKRSHHHSAAMRAKISRAVKASMRRRSHGGSGSVKRSSRRRVFRRRSNVVTRSVVFRPIRGRTYVRRNPGLGSLTGAFKSAFSKDMLMTAGGAVVASFGTGYILSKWGANLPMANNKWGRVAYSVAIPIGLAFLVRKKNRNLANGMIIGGLVMGINAIIQQVRPASGPVSGMPGVTAMGVAGELGAPRDFSFYPANSRRASIGAPMAMRSGGAFPQASPWSSF